MNKYSISVLCVFISIFLYSCMGHSKINSPIIGKWKASYYHIISDEVNVPDSGLPSHVRTIKDTILMKDSNIMEFKDDGTMLWKDGRLNKTLLIQKFILIDDNKLIAPPDPDTVHFFINGDTLLLEIYQKPLDSVTTDSITEKLLRIKN